MFFKNAKTMLRRTGEIHVTHKVKDPYNQWKVVDEAKKCGLVLKESVEFNKADYPGYTNRRGAEPIVGGTFFLGECRTYKFILRESMTTPIISPKNSKESLPEIQQAMWELQPDRKNREAAETAKANMERDEFERQRNEAMHQRDEARREKEIITIQLAEAMRLKENAVEQRAVSILELTFEREARKAAETAKENMEDLLNHFRRLVYNLHGDHALCQMEEAYREKEKIAKQLDEALKLKEEVTKEREKIQREQTDLANQKDEVYREKEKSSKWLDEVLILKEETIKEREKILREQTDLFNQKDEALWEKEKISEQLDEAVTLKQEVLKEMERILRKQTDLSDQKDEVFWEKEQIAEQVDEAVTLKQEVPKEMERIPSKQNDCNNPKNEVYGMKENIAKWLDVALRLKDEVLKKMKGFSRLAVALKLLNVITNLVESIRLKEGKGFDWRELLRIVTPLLFGGLKW
ncbi:hypothetical protein KI387_017939 [Taxus chinensis]|uniref:25S rRNA (uridine-N(3))-methyltransferase BMT5-like domain-containing protein n=1 Tax=Taxus chinensis TaxID=29808 RepID=A0AA38LHX7_TAXCH|nr:hypothetical protein KI387_017939 [Taxus chinensis]